jgi:hypothetical protein
MEGIGKLRMSDDYIFGWNSRLYEAPKDMNFMTSAVYTNATGIDVKIRPNVSNGMIMSSLGMTQEEVLLDPPVKYKIVFSVVENCIDEFDEIMDMLSEREFDNHVWKNTKNKEVVIPTKSVKKSQSKHKIGKVEYIRYEWKMTGSLSEVMALCYIIESSVEIFGKCWGVTEDGEKVCQMKYPIGSIVCIDGDKSTDYLVLDWSFDLLSPSFHNTYDVVAMVERPGSAVFGYDKRQSVNESRISPSRNIRIDDILEGDE